MKHLTIIEKLLTNKMFKDSFWALFGNAANKGLALVAGVLIARFLGTELYGEYGMIKNTLLYIAVFSTFGLGFTSTKFVSQSKEKSPEKLPIIINAASCVSIIFSGIMCLFVLVFAEQIAHFLEAENLTDILRYTAVTIVFNSLATVQIGILAGLQEFKASAYINFVVGLITFVSSVLLTYFYSLEGAIIALLISNIINCVLNLLYIQKKQSVFVKSAEQMLAEAKTMIKFSTPIAIQELAFSVSFWLSNLLLIKMANYSELGLYSAAAQWAGAILFIPGVLQNVMLSYLSKTADKGDDHALMLKRSLIINFVSAFVPFVIIFCLTSYIVSWYGPSYNGLGLVLNLSVLLTVVRCLVQVYVQEYIAIGATWALCFIRLGRDIISLVGAAVLIQCYEQNAAALYCVAFMVASVLCLLVLYLYHKRIYKFVNI